MAEMSLLQALHMRTKDKMHVYMTGHVIVYVIECVTSFQTSYSTKTRNVDVSYQTLFFPTLFTQQGKRFWNDTVIKFVINSMKSLPQLLEKVSRPLKCHSNIF